MTASRRVLRITLTLALLAAPFAVEGQPVGKGYYRRGAIFVDKILKGANPAELPVERATRFEFVNRA